MRYLSTALAVEGSSDEDFLPPLLTRALDDLCARSDVPVEVADVEVLPVPRPRRIDNVCAAARERLDSLSMVFYHYDGTADVDSARQQYWRPMAAKWQQLPGDRDLVPVVPVREMEAWALADVEALREVVGSDWVRRSVFQADRLPDVERLEDPKLTLKKICARGHGRRLDTPPAKQYLPRIAELISLEKLRAVPSFRQWSTDTVDALRRMRFLS